MESSRQNRPLSPVWFFAILTSITGVLSLTFYFLSGMYELLSELPALFTGILALFISISIVHFTPFKKFKIASWVIGALAFICSIIEAVLYAKENAAIEADAEIPEWVIINGVMYGTPSMCFHQINLGLWTLVLGTILLGVYSLFYRRITSRSEKGELTFWVWFYGIVGFIVALSLHSLGPLELLVELLEGVFMVMGL